jgi:hypothetical protein
MLWFRKSAAVHEKTRAVGVDLTSSRVRAVAVAVATGKSRVLTLDNTSDELPLFVALDRRTPEVGHAGYSLCRKTPHALCSNFLPALGQPREWRNGRHVLSPDAALELALSKVRGPVAAESEAAVLVLPAYLTPAQVTRVVATAARAKLPVKGTAVGPLALVADRAAAILTGKPAAPELPSPEWVVPLRPTAGGPGAVAVIDADEHGLSVTQIGVERDRVRLISTTCWPRFSVRAWKDRLLDAVSDRCVRLCRRDPRDSADAEQSLYEQLDDAMEHARTGQRVSLTVRTDRWFQDVTLQPDEFDALAASMARGAAESFSDWVVIDNAGQPLLPRAIWLTHEAGRLPGLARTLHANTPEGMAVEVLPPAAVALAAAALAPRWLSGELPKAHLDTAIPLAPGVAGAADKPAKGLR